MLKPEEVVVEPEKVGRNFWVRKDNYNLSAPRLWSLEVVVSRTLQLVNAILANPERADELIRYHWNLEDKIDLSTIPSTYTKADLMKDLKDLKTIVRTRLWE